MQENWPQTLGLLRVSGRSNVLATLKLLNSEWVAYWGWTCKSLMVIFLDRCLINSRYTLWWPGPSSEFLRRLLFSCFLFPLVPECVARVSVSLWGSGGWGCVRSTLRSRAQPSATVRTNSVWPCLWEVLQRWSFLEVSDVWLLRFAWQAWHFVTFRRVLQRVESRFAWQAQYFCAVFRRCVAVFVAGAALWTCPSSFFVAGAAL